MIWSCQIVAARIDTCRAYLDVLERSFRSNWLEAHDAYRGARLPLVDAFALAHPAHYEDMDSRSTVRGPRQFDEEIGIGALPCRGEIFWGLSLPARARHERSRRSLFPSLVSYAMLPQSGQRPEHVPYPSFDGTSGLPQSRHVYSSLHS
jgi:hypothetical protein